MAQPGIPGVRDGVAGVQGWGVGAAGGGGYLEGIRSLGLLSFHPDGAEGEYRRCRGWLRVPEMGIGKVLMEYFIDFAQLGTVSGGFETYIPHGMCCGE